MDVVISTVEVTITKTVKCCGECPYFDTVTEQKPYPAVLYSCSKGKFYTEYDGINEKCPFIKKKRGRPKKVK